MSAEIVKAAGQVATNTVAALASQPMMLALIVLQVLVLVVVLYSTLQRQKAISEQFKSVYELLEKCMLHDRSK
jgi:hypothetical protein